MDIRPETIAAGWLQGLPFYCGKTVVAPKRRLHGHQSDARRSPNRPIAAHLRRCGKHVRIVVIEIVPPEEDWADRERYWIEQSRKIFPEAILNIAEGGAGSAGLIQSNTTRTKISAALAGKKKSPEHIANMRGQKRSSETCARISTAKRGKKCEQMTAITRGRKFSLEHRAKLSIAAKMRKRSSHSPETRIKMSIAAKARQRNKLSPETRAKISAALAGRKKSAEHLAKISIALRGKKFSTEHCAAISASKR